MHTYIASMDNMASELMHKLEELKICMAKHKSKIAGLLSIELLDAHPFHRLLAGDEWLRAEIDSNKSLHDVINTMENAKLMIKTVPQE